MAGLTLEELEINFKANSAQFSKDLNKINRALTSQRNQLKKQQKEYKRLAESARASFGAMKTGSLVAGGLAAGMGAIYIQTLQSSKELQNQARQLGINAKSFSELAYATKNTGINTEQLTDTMFDLTERINDAAKAGSGELVEFFNEIGQSAEDWKRLAPEQQLFKMAEELNKMDSQDRLFWIDKINDAAKETMPAFIDNLDKINSYMREADEMGIGAFADDKRIGEAVEQWERLKQILSNVVKSVVVTLSPVFTQLKKDIVNFFKSANEEAKKGGFTNLGEKLGYSVLNGVKVAIIALNEFLKSAQLVAFKAQLAFKGEIVQLKEFDDATDKLKKFESALEQVSSDYEAMSDSSKTKSLLEKYGLDNESDLRSKLLNYMSYYGMVLDQTEQGIQSKWGNVLTPAFDEAKINDKFNEYTKLIKLNTGKVSAPVIEQEFKKEQQKPKLSTEIDRDRIKLAKDAEFRLQELKANAHKNEYQRLEAQEAHKIALLNHKYDEQHDDLMKAGLSTIEIERLITAEREAIQRDFGSKKLALYEKENSDVEQSLQEQLELYQSARDSVFSTFDEMSAGLSDISNANLMQLSESFIDTFEEIKLAGEDFALSMQDSFMLAAQAFDSIGQAYLSSEMSSINARRKAIQNDDKLTEEQKKKKLKDLDKEQKKLFEKQKQFKIASALMNVGLAISNALANIPPPANFAVAATVGAMGAAQVSAIKGQEYAGQAHAGIDEVPNYGKDSTWILQGGERVVSKEQNRDLKNFMSSNGKANKPNLEMTVNITAENNISVDEFFENNIQNYGDQIGAAAIEFLDRAM